MVTNWGNASALLLISLSSAAKRVATVPSTAIGKIDYDPPTRRLYIDFVTNGRRYVYFDVPPTEYDAFRRAFGKGTWFNAHIRDRYRHELVFDPKTDA